VTYDKFHGEIMTKYEDSNLGHLKFLRLLCSKKTWIPLNKYRSRLTTGIDSFNKAGEIIVTRAHRITVPLAFPSYARQFLPELTCPPGHKFTLVQIQASFGMKYTSHHVDTDDDKREKYWVIPLFGTLSWGVTFGTRWNDQHSQYYTLKRGDLFTFGHYHCHRVDSRTDSRLHLIVYYRKTSTYRT